MTSLLCVLGRQPAFGLAELESLYGPDVVKPVGSHAALLEAEQLDVSFAFLGGTVKFCKVLTILETINWQKIENFLFNAVGEHAVNLPAGKLKLGISVYGFNILPKAIVATGLKLKKSIRDTGRSVRLVPNTAKALNSAQVLHNQLTSRLGWELILVRNGNQTILAQTIAVQDIESYSKRDFGRPKRDARIGMLPPKLAQIIINLATARSVAPYCETPPKQNDLKQPPAVLDPFCGTGVILQEASLMGYRVYGTDLEPRMIDYCQTNLQWLGLDPKKYNLEVADATSHKWSTPYKYLASEAYLGRAFSSLPNDAVLSATIYDSNTIIMKFLQNLKTQTKSGFRLCIAVPAWRKKNDFIHLPLIDQIDKLGYNRISFVHVSQADLIYHREGQIVARELLILVRK